MVTMMLHTGGCVVGGDGVCIVPRGEGDLDGVGVAALTNSLTHSRAKSNRMGAWKQMVADLQKEAFLNDSETRGKWIDVGLWGCVVLALQCLFGSTLPAAAMPALKGRTLASCSHARR